MNNEKVPLLISWLSENGLLAKAVTVLGYGLIPNSANRQGVLVLVAGGRQVKLLYEDHLLFTVAQLLELNFFDPGDFQYCPHCGKLQVDCDAEQQAIYEHNHMYDNEGEQDERPTPDLLGK